MGEEIQTKQYIIKPERFTETNISWQKKDSICQKYQISLKIQFT